MRTKTGQYRTVAVLLISCLLWPSALWAQSAVDESPSAAAMAGDLVVARPIGLVMTVLGTAAFVVSLPFTVVAGSVGEAADTLMVGPAKTTFVRCLGCRNPGQTNKDDMDAK
ncbi:MAG: hypothetical protein HOC23_06885 [Halieaceae bacterium]|jgi:hypothetical protein|nr:hypothetical protein [Halieaceae bacterium]